MLTILGATGFIGSSLALDLQQKHIPFRAPSKSEKLEGSLGHVVFCIGLTADFRMMPYEVVDAHVNRLIEVLKYGNYQTLTYLSSARVYIQSPSTREEQMLTLNVAEQDNIYNLSKLLGEAYCLAESRCKVIRLSNVYGFTPSPVNFLDKLIVSAIRDREILLDSSLDSSKNYISIRDVVSLITRIACEGKDRIYNLASSSNVTNRQIVEILRKQTGCSVISSGNARVCRFPEIDISKIREEFGFTPRRLVDDLRGLINEYKAHHRIQAD